MNDWQKFVSPQPRDPYENLRVNPIENDKKRKEEPDADPPHASPSPTALAGLLHALKKPLDAFFQADPTAFLLEHPQQLLDALSTFENLLQELVETDLSHSPQYTQQLSTSWHCLQNNCHFLMSHLSEPPDYVKDIFDFLKEVSRYPLGQDHSLGNYLTAFAGEHWIPFPFMEILQKLHEECKTSPQSATLIQWVVTLSEILSS